MPYESFRRAHSLTIRGLMQDDGCSWKYLIEVNRRIRGNTPVHHSTACSTNSSSSSTTSASNSSQESPPCRRKNVSMTSAMPLPSQSYFIQRGLHEFKKLHAAMKTIMGDALPTLPVDSIFCFLLGENQSMLEKKRHILENILGAIEEHAEACNSPAYLSFIANTECFVLAHDSEEEQELPSHHHDTMVLSPVARYKDRANEDQPRRERTSKRRVEFTRFSLI